EAKGFIRDAIQNQTTESFSCRKARAKPADPEDDEGIHSSHEGGSDISDSASEGSDDSGLNGNGPGSGKLPNDPETPTDEIPTPTELKSHMFNVYYMNNASK
uniref:Uncharacterized protein n=1 Tax=Echeneis naucrates TaxID=173247 RepID=A0A665U262_ECHNA